MKLENKDTGTDLNQIEFIGFYNNDTNRGLYFQEHKLSFSYTDDTGDKIFELTDKQTFEMYKCMKRYFEKDLIN